MAKDGSQPPLYGYVNGSSGSGCSSGNGGLSAPSSSSVAMNVTESKIQYIRHMVYQNRSCRDTEVGVSPPYLDTDLTFPSAGEAAHRVGADRHIPPERAGEDGHRSEAEGGDAGHIHRHHQLPGRSVFALHELTLLFPHSLRSKVEAPPQRIVERDNK